ncbi:hypothetical protein [Prochlorococcus sp. MIT 1303]|uniref:hypothetical protein n=1 Tax=Prochlorococcus sp. MIT 1303 TaxID=1723647 RepID=UPI0007B3683F|nr:hypothetical protein [Prochlorococcus sp. MIT 1303]
MSKRIEQSRQATKTQSKRDGGLINAGQKNEKGTHVLQRLVNSYLQIGPETFADIVKVSLSLEMLMPV